MSSITIERLQWLMVTYGDVRNMCLDNFTLINFKVVTKFLETGVLLIQNLIRLMDRKNRFSRKKIN